MTDIAISNARGQPGTERRYHRRYRTDSAVTFSNGDRRLKGRVVDYSLGGVRVHWLDPFDRPRDALKVPQLVEMELARHLLIPAMVVHIDDDSVGMEFEAETLDLQGILVELRAHTPA